MPNRPLVLLTLLATLAMMLFVGLSPGAQDPLKPVKRHAVAPQYAASLTSANWAGYWAAQSIDSPQANSVLAVSGGWQVPHLTCGLLETSSSSSWVGMDGIASPTVEQVGTWARCTLGSPNYGAWLENYPSPITPLPLPVHAGDLMLGSVVWDQYGTITYNLTDITTGRGGTAPYTKPAAALLNSAEWVTENNKQAFGIFPLSNFGLQHWGQCSATIWNGAQGAFVGASIGNASHEHQEIVMADAGDGTVMADPSPLSTDGGAFSIQWLHS